MNQEPLISVIVPVYNVERYLDQCLESIVNQSYRHLEILVVDDGSTDSSDMMCDRWAERDERISVIHQPNGGLSAARNSALDVMKGEWVIKPTLEDAKLFTYVWNDRVAPAKMDGRWGCIDHTGQFVVKNQYNTSAEAQIAGRRWAEGRKF